MTTADLIQYYVNLLLIQYSGQPKAADTIKALVTMSVMDSLPLLVQQAYELDSAEGAQLDVIGKYAGVSRNGYDFTGPATLSDSDFRILIKMAILQNNASNSLGDIQSLINIFFPGTLRVFDYKTMQINYFLDSDAGTQQLAQFFVKQGLLPRPMGVEIGTLIFAPDIHAFLGFRSYSFESSQAPFNSYSSYQSNTPWLSYANAIYQ